MSELRQRSTSGPAEGASALPRAAFDPQEFLEESLLGWWCLAADGTVLWANRAAREPLGYRLEELLGQRAGALFVDPNAYEAVLGRLGTGDSVKGLEISLRRRDGSARPVLLSAQARADEQGRPLQLCLVTEDAPPRTQATSDVRARAQHVDDAARPEVNGRERPAGSTREGSPRCQQDNTALLGLLNKLSNLWAQPLEYEGVVRSVAELALPTLADFVVLDLREDEGVRRVVRAHDEQTQQILRELHWSPTASELALAAAASGAPIVRTHIDEAWLCDFAPGPEQLELVRKLAIGSVISVPLLHGEGALGALTLVFGGSIRQHSEADRSLAEVLARCAAAALVQTQLFQAARLAVEVRDNFLSLAGHELRTPLTALQLQILSITKLVAQTEGMEKITTRAEKATRNVLRLSSLVNELLEISRISAGRLRLERELTDLGELAREVVGRHSEELSRNGCEVRLALQPAALGSWDRARIEQIAAHVLGTAIKLSKGKPIDVSVERDVSVARLLVRNYGAGIAPEDQVRVFQRFERAMASRHFGSLGLGLWIARQLAEAHGGTMRITSEHDRGASFEIDLPLLTPSEVQA